jgi:DNA-binding NarL/FixJ family response regulator
MQAARQGSGLLVSGDLIFSTKISGTARALGIDMQVVGSAGSAREHVERSRPRCIIFDLSLPGLTQEAMAQIVQLSAGVNVLAYGSHVDTARLQQARDAGCTDVMPRSRLSNELPALLERYCQ